MPLRRLPQIIRCADRRLGRVQDAGIRTYRGEASVYNSSGSAMRHFCPRCGTGLWYANEEYLPGLIDIQVATLDDPDALPPQAHIQVAERIGWMKDIAGLPEFERYPG